MQIGNNYLNDSIACLLLSLSLTLLFSVRLWQFIVPFVTYLGNIVICCIRVKLFDVERQRWLRHGCADQCDSFVKLHLFGNQQATQSTYLRLSKDRIIPLIGRPPVVTLHQYAPDHIKIIRYCSIAIWNAAIYRLARWAMIWTLHIMQWSLLAVLYLCCRCTANVSSCQIIWRFLGGQHSGATWCMSSAECELTVGVYACWGPCSGKAYRGQTKELGEPGPPKSSG